MPKRKYAPRRRFNKRRRTTGRKMARRRRYSRGTATASAVGRSLMPTKLKRTFNYCSKITLDGASVGIADSKRFSCNSMFDPDRTGVGHQPMGFDQFLGVLFDHYTVIGAKITVSCMAQTNTRPDANQIISIKVIDSSTSSTDITTSIEQGRVVYGMLGGSDGNASTLKLTHTCNPAKFLGRSKPLSDPELKGSVSSNPNEECFFEINAASIEERDPPPVDVLVTVQYTAILTERIRLGQS